MFTCTCHAFHYAMIQQLYRRLDLNLVTDNSCVKELSHVIPVRKAAVKVVPLSNVVTKCFFFKL